MRILTVALRTPFAEIVECAADPDEGLEFARTYEFDVILTSCEGFAKVLRDAKVTTPLIIMSDSADVVRELDSGADDVLPASVPHEFLAARVRAMVRRSRGLARSIVIIDNMALDLTSRMVTVSGRDVHLTGKEYQMLELLALRRGSVQTKEVFLGHLYGGMDEPEIKIIDVFMCKLRRKLRDAGGPEIQTVWGRGYLFHAEHAAPSLAPELADITDDPPVHVSKMTAMEYDAMRTKRAKKAGQSA
jgi:two-component system cell cycle response regulator CtrA